MMVIMPLDTIFLIIIKTIIIKRKIIYNEYIENITDAGAEMDFDSELSDNNEAIETLEALGHLQQDLPEYGVAKQWVNQGIDSLSPKQKRIFDKHIAPVVFKKCEMCDDVLSLPDLVAALDHNDGKIFCSYHRYLYDKND